MTDPSLTSSARSSLSYLAARDARQEALVRALGEGYRATVVLALNIPGAEKQPPGAEALFRWGLSRLAAVFSERVVLTEISDLLGPCAIVGVNDGPENVKRCGVNIETETPSARLLDIDVYALDGRQMDRMALGLPARACLICKQSAMDCIRAKRHSFDVTIAKVHELLKPYRD